MEAAHIRLDPQSQSAPHVLPYPPRVTLEIVRGRARRLVRRVLPPVFLIGAASDCDLVLGDEQFPEAFAYVYVTAEGVTIRHLGAAPDLRVNGRPVETAALADGDRLAMGPYEFAINIESGDPRGGGIRAHDGDGDLAAVPYDILGLDTAAGNVRRLLAEIRQQMRIPALDLGFFGPAAADRSPARSQFKPLVRRPLAGFVSRRASA